MGRGRAWTDEQLVEAVRLERSISGVCRRLGTSTGSNAWTVKRRIELLGLDTRHFGTAPIDVTRLRDVVARCSTFAMVVEALGLPLDAATHTKVRRAIRAHGLSTRHFARVWSSAPMPRRWSDEQLRAAVATSQSRSMVLRALGLVPLGGNYATVQRHIERLGLDTSHFTGKAWSRGKTFPGQRRPLEEILVKDRPLGSHSLKERLINAGIKRAACEACGWAVKSPDGRIPIELDHINGDRNDNRLENLRILCPNCHALQPTHRGLNKRSRRK